MDIRELKTMDAPGLVKLAGSFEIENAGVLRRQELVYRIIQAQARRNGQLVADGVLETVPEGFGFLRALEASYLPGPDDVFVSAVTGYGMKPLWHQVDAAIAAYRAGNR